MFYGATPTADAEFDTFAAPVAGAPLPRWERKALEATTSAGNLEGLSLPPRERGNKTPTPSTSTTPSRKTPRSSRSNRKKTPGSRGAAAADRFIPNRSAMDLDLCRLALTFDATSGKENGSGSGSGTTPTSPSSSRTPRRARAAAAAAAAAAGSISASSPGSKASTLAGYNSALASTLLDADPATAASAASSGSLYCDLPGSKILAFKNKAPAPEEGYQNPNRALYCGQATATAPVRRKMFRHIPQAPEKILDAPSLLEDFYLNLLDWGANNTMAVALAETVYLWNAATGSIETLCETTDSDDCITSVSWLPDGHHLAVGTNKAEVQIWDAEKMACVRRMRSHSARVGSLAWNGAILSSGSRDSQIHNHDTRIQNHHVATLAAHTQEVCGLKWSPNGSQLASGGNDNLVAVWDNQSSAAHWKPKFTFDHHNGAVKALAWCPWQTSLLATGGGTADRHLRFWNTTSGACVNSIDTNSQVCSILWSPHEKELVTSHGFSQNQLTVWKYPTLARMAELKGHTSRVLHMALSPDGQTVVSGAADETLRFWKVFAKQEAGKAARGGQASKTGGLSSTGRSILRGVNIR